jgi:hypothetical protein
MECVKSTRYQRKNTGDGWKDCFHEIPWYWFFGFGFTLGVSFVGILSMVISYTQCGAERRAAFARPLDRLVMHNWLFSL